jgi:hypothetical protein
MQFCFDRRYDLNSIPLGGRVTMQFGFDRRYDLNSIPLGGRVTMQFCFGRLRIITIKKMLTPPFMDPFFYLTGRTMV